jgi:hypothetical protein
MAMQFRDIILLLCGLLNAGAIAYWQTTLFISHHSLNLNLVIEPYQAKDLVKGLNARHPNASLGILVQNNLSGLIWYVRTRPIEGCPLIPWPRSLMTLRMAIWPMKHTANWDKGKNI